MLESALALVASEAKVVVTAKEAISPATDRLETLRQTRSASLLVVVIHWARSAISGKVPGSGDTWTLPTV